VDPHNNLLPQSNLFSWSPRRYASVTFFWAAGLRGVQDPGRLGLHPPGQVRPVPQGHTQEVRAGGDHASLRRSLSLLTLMGGVWTCWGCRSCCWGRTWWLESVALSEIIFVVMTSVFNKLPCLVLRPPAGLSEILHTVRGRRWERGRRSRHLRCFGSCVAGRGGESESASLNGGVRVSCFHQILTEGAWRAGVKNVWWGKRWVEIFS
jgi:hypothetical protein